MSAGERSGRWRVSGRGVWRVLLALALGSLLATVVAAPVVLGGGLALQSLADRSRALPSDVTAVRLPQRSVLTDATGRMLVELHGPEDRVVVALPAIAPVMQQAIVAVEDARFYAHHGLDFRGLLRAVVHNGQGGSTQGASTLTQQYVKLSLLERAGTPAQRATVTSRSSYLRKLREARLALILERHQSKQQILAGYLNIAYFGEGAYGVDTAAARYFGVPASALSLPQAALLAGLVNSPTLYDPLRHPQAARGRRDLVLRRMLTEHMITQAEFGSATASGLGANTHRRPALADECENATAAFYCDWIRTQLRADVRLGGSQAARDDTLFNGGLHIRTTLDPAVQAATQAAVDAAVPRSDRITAVAVVVQPGTGRVLAMAANRTYSSKPGVGHTKLGYLGYRPIFQGGSTFKAFTLLAALQQGLALSTSFFAPACYRPDPVSWDVPGLLGACPGGYQNSDPTEAGVYDAVKATWNSVNTYYIQLEQQVGIAPIIKAATELGIRPATFTGLGARSLSLTLGGVEGVSPLEEASAYATLAAHGRACDPVGILRATDAQGHDLTPSTGRGCRQVIDPHLADTVTGVFQGVLTQPGATAYGKTLPGRPAAGKTGTVDNQSAAWFVGYTPQLSTAVVLGDPAAPSQPMGTVQGINPVYGGTLPAQIWQQAMTNASAPLPVQPLPPAIPDAVSPQPPTPGTGPTPGTFTFVAPPSTGP